MWTFCFCGCGKKSRKFIFSYGIFIVKCHSLRIETQTLVLVCFDSQFKSQKMQIYSSYDFWTGSNGCVSRLSITSITPNGLTWAKFYKCLSRLWNTLPLSLSLSLSPMGFRFTNTLNVRSSVESFLPSSLFVRPTTVFAPLEVFVRELAQENDVRPTQRKREIESLSVVCPLHFYVAWLVCCFLVGR